MMSDRKSLESILSNIPGGVAIFSDHDGKVHLDYTNDGFYSLHYGSREFWSKKSDNPVDWLIPSDRHIFEDEFALVKSGEKDTGDVSYCVTGEDGGIHWVNNQFRRAYVSDGIQYYYSSFTGLDKLKLSEEERNRVNLMYQAAVEDAKLVVWEYDICNHRVTMAENEFTKYDYRKFGLPKVINNVPDTLVPYIEDSSVPAFVEMYRSVDNGAPTASCEVWYKTASAREPRCEHIRYVTLFDENGKPVKAYGIGQNTTAQKLEHEKYAMLYKQITGTLSESVLSVQLNISKNVYIGMYSPDPDVKKRYSGTTAEDHFALMLKYLADGKYRADLASLFNCENLISLYKNGTTQISREYPVKTLDESVMWVNTTAYLLQNPNTGDIELVTFVKDITKLRKDEEIIRYLAKDGCDFVGIADTRMKTFTLYDGGWNYSLLRKDVPVDFNMCREKLAEQFVPEKERKNFLAMTGIDTITTNLTYFPKYTVAYSFIENNGECLKKQLRFTMLGSSIQELLVIQNDVTETSRREQQQITVLQEALIEAEKANTAKSEFVSRISHDIRTPISIISSMTRFAQQDADDRKKLDDDLRKIEASNVFLLSLINDVLDISKIDSGKIELHSSPYLFADYISNIRNMFEPLCSQKHISLVIDRHPDAAAILVDQTRFNQITLNLVSNAVKYTPEGGTVTFSAGSTGMEDGKTACTISVKDTGIGMSEKFQKVMFEPFSQEYDNPGRDKTIMGTGLGLSIVKKIVDLMGGTITVESALGKGTCISVVIPAETAEPLSQSSSAVSAETENARQFSGTLLLAEDNILNTEIAERILESIGFSVVHAENGKAAVDLFASAAPGTFAAVLMDIQMPVMNGYEAAEQIRSLGRSDAGKVPIIAMTADAFSAAIEHSRAVGMNDYVTKPIDPGMLRRVLEKYC
jgi:signal transduction histidine kinase/CheY-like chemotaxis protein